MAIFEYKDLEFSEDKKNPSLVKVIFLRLYYFHLKKEDLSEIGDFKLSAHRIEFDCSEKRAANKWGQLLSKGFESLVCVMGGLPAVYVHKNSGIPLIGEGVFGLIDRNTNCIEVKPLTCCNLDCVFCSVDAGTSSKKAREFIVEKDYLVEEFNKLAEKKEHDVEAHIGPQGEPLLYAPLADLIRDLRQNPKVKVISIDTNGTLLTRKLVDELAEAGLTRLNISLQSMDESRCNYLAGTHYNLKHVLEMIDYAKHKMNVLLAPVIVPGLNDSDLKLIVEKGKEIKSEYPSLGIQNYLNYKRGRNPVKQRSWDEFFGLLAPYEKSHDVRLKLSKEDFGIKADTKLEKPFEKKQVIKAIIASPGPMKDEKIAVYKGRAIIVEKARDARLNSAVKILIIRDKHNIFRGVLQR